MLFRSDGKAVTVTENRFTAKRHSKVVITAVPNSYNILQSMTAGSGSVTQGVLTIDDLLGNESVDIAYVYSQLSTLTAKVEGTGGAITSITGSLSESIAPDAAAVGINVPIPQDITFTAAPTSGYMVKEWKVNNIVQSELGNTFVLKDFGAQATVTVEFETPITLWTIPGNATGYTVTNVKKSPIDYGTANQIRDRGTVTFTVAASDADSIISTLSVTGGEVTKQRNADGSWTVTVSNVSADHDSWLLSEL